ncbi:MAG: hypothetical protein KDC45_06605, partial [Bacteroidetes bacterium]|nr:hypothetical protein [Bacteroidota bacterium]
MENLIPGLLILHIFGMILWLGASLTQYIFLSDALLNPVSEVRRWSMELNQKINKTAVNMGLIISILTGVALIFVHGMDWFRPRLYVHFKISFGILAAGLAHMGMAKLRKAGTLLDQVADFDAVAYETLVKKWRLF